MVFTIRGKSMVMSKLLKCQFLLSVGHVYLLTDQLV